MSEAGGADPERKAATEIEDPETSLTRVVIATIATTAVVTTASYVAPEDYTATAVGMLFLGATYALVLRYSSAYIERHGLALGGLFEPEPLSVRRIARDFGSSLAVALGVFAIIAVPFTIGFRMFHQWTHQLHHAFDWHALGGIPKEALGQLLVIALPEEAFFRGYLQTELEAFFPKRVRFLGAELSLAIPVASLVFAVGHVFTRPSPERIAVFFPALLFGFLRTRTRGIGASVLFHASCNLLSATLLAGYKIRS